MCVLKLPMASKGADEALLGPMFLGHNREEEMSVMVAALTHVVSGEVSDWKCYGDGGGDVGEKRQRVEERGGGCGGGMMLSESVSRACSAYGDFSLGGTSSNIRG